MGSFIARLRNIPEPKSNCPLMNLSLTKIRELHGGFKSVCDHFSINLTEFEQIFNANEATFAIWDTDNNGLIDALELFCGLILFSESRAEDKIRFIFDLFDFNEIQTISVMDLEFLVQCCLVSSCKMYNIGEDVPEIEISELVAEAFPEDHRVTINQLLKWCVNTDEIRHFFRFFRIEGLEQLSKNKTLGDKEFQIFHQHNQNIDVRFGGSPKKYFQIVSPSQLYKRKRNQYYRAWLNGALAPILSHRLSNAIVSETHKQINEIKGNLEWVYGIRSQDTKRTVQYSVGAKSALASGKKNIYHKRLVQNSEEFLYFTACIIILYNPRIKRQRFYTEHTQEIISAAISNDDGSYIASGEIGQKPFIHVWNSRTLNNICILGGIHSEAVHSMSFTENDVYLVTAGLTTPSSIVVYDWKVGLPLQSTRMMCAIQELAPLGIIQPSITTEQGTLDPATTPSVSQGIVVFGTEEIEILDVWERTLLTTSIPFTGCTTTSPILCGLGMHIEPKNAFAKPNDNLIQHRLVLTGHENGCLCVWKPHQFQAELANYRAPIIAITFMGETIAISNSIGHIAIWDKHLLKCTRKLELNDLPFKLLSNNIGSVDYNHHKLLVCTKAGDVIEIWISDSIASIKATKYGGIVKLESDMYRAMSILNDYSPSILVGGDNGMVMTYDIETHNLIDIWHVGKPITAMHSVHLQEGGYVAVVGTLDGHLYVRQDWEEHPRQQSLGEKAIKDVRLSPTCNLLAVASEDKSIYMLELEENEYRVRKQRRLDKGFPVSLIFSQDSTYLLISNNQRKLMMLDPRTLEMNFTVEDVSRQYWDEWLGKCPVHTKSTTAALLPATVAHTCSMIAGTDENGTLYLWRDHGELLKYIGSNYTGSSSQIGNIEFTQDDTKLFTLGTCDQTLLQWKIRPLMSSDPYDPNELKIIIQNDSLINEINYSRDDSIQQEKMQDYSVLIKGTKNKLINGVLSRGVVKEDEKRRRMPPRGHLKLEYIYGVQTGSCRGSVQYLHYYSQTTQGGELGGGSVAPPIHNCCLGENLANINQMGQPSYSSLRTQLGVLGNLVLPKHIERLLMKEFQSPYMYEKQHEKCEQFVIYFISRLAIIYEPRSNRQIIYEGHQSRICCMVKHPIFPIIASGEAKHMGNIHIWNCQGIDNILINPLVILKTAHDEGIFKLCFSYDGEYLLTIGRAMTIQIFNWRQERELCFRHLSKLPIYDVKFNPFDSRQFVEIGYLHIGIWKLAGRHLNVKNYIKLPEKKNELNQKVLICSDYINREVGNSTESDIVFGSNLGDISVLMGGKYFMLEENAHHGPVNMVKVTDCIKAPFCIISVGEDGLIKIWDSSMDIIYAHDVRELDFMGPIKEGSFGIQSLDIYACRKQRAVPELLLGLRSGDIISATLIVESRAAEQLAIKCEYIPLIREQSSLNKSKDRRRVHFALHPFHPIMASISDDKTIRIRDIHKHTLYSLTNLGKEATAVAFTPDGNFIAIGLQHGTLVFMSIEIRKADTYDEKFEKPRVKMIGSVNTDCVGAVLCIKFTSGGALMAVSFDNEIAQTTNQHNQKVQTKEPNSVIKLYVNTTTKMGKKEGNTKTAKRLYEHLFNIRIPFAQFDRGSEELNEMAVPFMEFSEDGTILVCSAQKVNFDGNTEFGKDPVYAFWDINENVLIEPTSLPTLKLQNWTLPSSIYGRYLNNRLRGQTPEEDRDLLLKEQVIMSSICRFWGKENDIMIAGCLNGDFHLFRSSALSLDKSLLELGFEGLAKDEMSIAKSYSGHCSRVNQVEISFDDEYVFTTALSDQAIIQWKVNYEDMSWELDFNPYYLPEISDPFAELPKYDRFRALLTEIWVSRREVLTIFENIDPALCGKPPCELVQENIIGRRAFDRRNNLKYDIRGRYVFVAGSQVVFQETIEADEETGRKAHSKQTFLSPEVEKDYEKYTSCYPEISTLTVSNDRRVIAIGTGEVEAHIYIWECCTLKQMARINVPSCSLIMYLAFNHDSKYIAAVGVTQEYRQCLLLIDIKEKNILSMQTFIHSLPFRIKDICFIPQRSMMFVTVGIQHIQFWEMAGKNLQQRTGEFLISKSKQPAGGGLFSMEQSKTQGRFGLNLVVDPKMATETTSSRQNAEDLENVHVSFLVVKFIAECMITCGDDGFLYLWEDVQIIKRVSGHESSIMSMDVYENPHLVVTGAMDGSVVLWRFMIEPKSQQRSLDKLRAFSVAQKMDMAQLSLDPSNNIQSVSIAENKVLVGTRVGHIFETYITDQGEKLVKPGQTESIPIKQRLYCMDDEIPQSISTDMVLTRMFCITKNGKFSAWDMSTLELLFSQNFGKAAKMIYSFKLSNHLLIAFENEIIVLDRGSSTSSFSPLPNYSFKSNEITDVKIAYSERIMAVATQSQKSPQVDLFDLDEGFTQLQVITGFKYMIRYLDFSSDNAYLMCEDDLGEVVHWDIFNERILHSTEIEHEIEWVTEGLRNSPTMKGAAKWYNDYNPMKAIVKAPGKPFVAIGDQQGVIRLFKYPNKSGEGYFAVYPEHLYSVSQCLFSGDRKLFFTISEGDRCIYKWAVKYNI